VDNSQCYFWHYTYCMYCTSVRKYPA